MGQRQVEKPKGYTIQRREVKQANKKAKRTHDEDIPQDTKLRNKHSLSIYIMKVM